MKNKILTIDFNSSTLLNENGSTMLSQPTIAYKANPTWELHFVSIADDGTMNPVDLTEATAWHAAIDTDFSSSTEPMVRTFDDGIDHSGAASGVLLVSLDAATTTFKNKIDNRERLQAYFEVRGLDADSKVVYDYRFRCYALGAVDPEGGEPLPIESGGVTLDTVYSIVNGMTDGMQPLITNEAKLAYSLVSGAPAVPTSTSQLTNDSGYQTASDVADAVSGKQDIIDVDNKLDYSLLSGTPAVPTVNDGTLTVKYGTDVVGTFTANSSSDIEVVIPSSAASTDWSGQIAYMSRNH